MYATLNEIFIVAGFKNDTGQSDCNTFRKKKGFLTITMIGSCKEYCSHLWFDSINYQTSREHGKTPPHAHTYLHGKYSKNAKEALFFHLLLASPFPDTYDLAAFKLE